MKHAALYAALTILTPAFALSQPPVTGLSVTSTGDLLIGSQRGLEIAPWSATDDREQLPTIDEPVHCIRLSPDGRLVAVGGGMAGEWGRLWVLRREDWKPVHVRLDHDDTIMGLDWSPDGRLLATASLDANMIIYHAESLEPIHQFEGHSKGILDVVFVDDENVLTASRDTTIRLWSVPEKKMIRTLKNHTEAVTGLMRMTVDAGALPMVASISQDRTIRFWQPTIGRLVRFVRLAGEEPLCMTQTRLHGWIKVGGSSGSLYTIDHRDASMKRRALSDGRLISLALHPRQDEIVIGEFNGELRTEKVEEALESSQPSTQ